MSEANPRTRPRPRPPSPKGANSSANPVSRAAGVNLWEYITDLSARLPSHPVNRLEQLLPDNWQPAHH